MENHVFADPFFRQLDPRQFLQLFEMLPDLSFFAKDLEGRFVAINSRACEYCGVSSESEAIGKTDHDFFPPDRADLYRADDLKVIESGEAIVNRIENAPESAESPRLVMTSKLPLKDRRGRIVGVAGFSRQVEKMREHSESIASFADVIEYLHKHYSDPLTTAELAERAKLSPSQFERRFRRMFGVSPRQYLIRVRVDAAAKLLAETDRSIVSIANHCGFYDHAHFSRSFRSRMNLSPSQYRDRHRRID